MAGSFPNTVPGELVEDWLRFELPPVPGGLDPCPTDVFPAEPCKLPDVWLLGATVGLAPAAGRLLTEPLPPEGKPPAGSAEVTTPPPG